MAKKSKLKGYFGFGRLLTVLAAIFPPTNIIFGIVIRVRAGNVLGVLLNIILAPIFYIIDLVTIIVYNKVSVLA